MRHGIYAHPWDLRDLEARGGPGRLAELGFGDLSLAIAYHAGRWFTPQSRDGAVRFLEDGVVHFRPSSDYGALRPLASQEVPKHGPSPLRLAITAGRVAGLRMSAWAVLNHNSRLGRMHPDSCVQNALGDHYRYALCPARREVLEYDLQVVADLAAHDGLDAIELEAFGFMGHRHGSHHDKTSFGSEPYTDFLLSYCFCDACQAGIADEGGDPDALRSEVARLLRERLVDGDALEHEGMTRAAANECLTERLGDGAAALLRHRLSVYRQNLDRVREIVDGRCRIAIHLHFDPMFTGSQLGAPLSAVSGLVDEVVVTYYGEPPDKIAEEWQNQPTGEVAAYAAIWPKAPEYRSDDDLCRALSIVGDHGGAGIRIYHLGLLPWRTIERVAAAFE